uniref:Uncharacterized protein n=1 Tax=Elaeophora elaphi TaxID=1147741 RepID=A0A0R3S5H9_9BILA
MEGMEVAVEEKPVFGLLPHGTRYLGTLRHPLLLLLDDIPYRKKKDKNRIGNASSDLSYY